MPRGKSSRDPRITVEATSDELATIFRARADVAEAKAVEVEREAAEPEPEDKAQARSRGGSSG